MLFNKKSVAAVAAIAALPTSFAQVSTVCNPLNVTCPNGLGLSTSSYFMDFTKQTSFPSDWTSALDEYTYFDPNMGAVFNFGKQGDAPTIYSNFFFFFGRIEYVAQVASGQGIVSSMVLLSDDLDEIDWEFTGTNVAQAQTNYFGKGVLNYGVSEYVSVASPQTKFHTYAIDWSPTELVWSIDGAVVRTLTAAQAGNEFPQTPMKVSLGVWDGGDASKQAPGTVQWAGGPTELPPKQNYTSYVKSVKITNANPAMQYEYTDNSGSWKSIKAINNTASSSAALSTSSSMASSTISPSAMVASASGMSNSVPANSTVANFVGEVVFTTVTSCPISTTKIANGTTSVMQATSVSTILLTSTSTVCTRCQAPQVTSSTVTPAMISSTAARMSASSVPTVSAVTTELVYTTLTTCPVTSTQIANGTTAVLNATSVSTILSTSTSTVCTKCVAPPITSSLSSSIVQNPATAMPPHVAANAYRAYTAAHACTGSAPVPGFTPPVSSIVQSTIVSTIVSASSTTTSSVVTTSVVWTYPVKTTTSTTQVTLYSTGFRTVTDSESSIYVSSTVVPTIVPSTVIVTPVEAAAAQTSPASLTSLSTTYSTLYNTLYSTVIDRASSTSLATTVIPSVLFSPMPAATPSSSSSLIDAVNPVNGLPAVAPITPSTTTTTLSSTSTLTASGTPVGYLNGTVAGTGVAASSGFPITTANPMPFIGAAAHVVPAASAGLAIVVAFAGLFL